MPEKKRHIFFVTFDRIAQSPRVMRVLMGLAAFVSLAAIMATLTLFVVSVWVHEIPAGPITYSSGVYTPIVGTLCPGDMLEAEIETTTVGGTYIVIISSSFFGTDDEGRRYVIPLPLTASALVNDMPRDEITRRVITAHEVIPDLPPGDYAYRHAVGTLVSEADGYEVPFTVPPGCPP